MSGYDCEWIFKETRTRTAGDCFSAGERVGAAGEEGRGLAGEDAFAGGGRTGERDAGPILPTTAGGVSCRRLEGAAGASSLRAALGSGCDGAAGLALVVFRFLPWPGGTADFGIAVASRRRGCAETKFRKIFGRQRCQRPARRSARAAAMTAANCCLAQDGGVGHAQMRNSLRGPSLDIRNPESTRGF